MPSQENMLPEDETVAKLRSLLEGLESRSDSAPVTARNQQQRVGKIRAAITNLVKKEARKVCCCRLITVGLHPEEFEADMAKVTKLARSGKLWPPLEGLGCTIRWLPTA